MIKTERVDGLLRIYADADVVTSYASGDHRQFAPDGESLLVESEGVAYRYFFDLEDCFAFEMGLQFDWNGTLRRIIGNDVPKQPLDRAWSAWFAGRQNGDWFLHSTFREYYHENNQPWTLCVFDCKENRVVQQFAFESAMPGATWAKRPHDLRYLPETGTWIAWLSGYANPGWKPNAMYAFDCDGSGVIEILGSEHMSHPTLCGDRVAYGINNDIMIGNLNDAEPLIGEGWHLSESYGHGTLIGDKVCFSNAERFENELGLQRARDVQVMLLNVNDDKQRVIRDIPEPTDLFAARARPTLSHDGTKAAWQELHNGHACVMVKDLGGNDNGNLQHAQEAITLLKTATDQIERAMVVLGRIELE